jgi:hypothetical protein
MDEPQVISRFVKLADVVVDEAVAVIPDEAALDGIYKC